MEERGMMKLKGTAGGVTLISLVVTIIILLILARNYNCIIIRRKWYNKESKRGKRSNEVS